MASTQTCSIPDCNGEALFRTRTKPSWCDEHLDDQLAEKRLSPVEPFQHPKTPWLVLCQVCEYQTHVFLDYILTAPQPCTVCHWRAWEQGIYDSAQKYGMDPYYALEINVSRVSDDEAVSHAQANGYTYLERVPNTAIPASDIHLVQCRHCRRRQAARSGDIGWGCSCRVNPRRADQPDPSSRQVGKKRLLREEHAEEAGRLWDSEANDPELWETVTFRARYEVSWRCPDCDHRWQTSPSDMSSRFRWRCPECEQRRRETWDREIKAYKTVPVSEVPELMEMWDDPEKDPETTMVSGGSRSVRFRCLQGHTMHNAPYSVLRSGCPSCRALETRRRRAQEATQSPQGSRLDRELVSQWHPSKNKRAPADVGPDSRAMIWWRDPNCGTEWQETPRDRTKRFRLRCPSCESLLDSLAWHFPEVAEEWSPDNDMSPWHVRPATKLAFVPWWVCKTDPSHRWQASAASRTNGGKCPQCVGFGKSAVELSFHAAAERVFGEAQSGAIIYSDLFRRRGRWTADILVDSPEPACRGVVIEYDGAYWHKDKAEVDADKSVDLLAAGYAVVRLREKPLAALPMNDPRYLEIPVHLVSDPDAVIAQVKDWVDALP